MRISTRQPLLLGQTIIAMAICVLLMWVDLRGNTFEKFRSASNQLVQPIYQISRFTSRLGKDTVNSKEYLRRDNIRLKATVLQLKAQIQQQDYLLSQNKRLRKILAINNPQHYDLHLAQVIGVDQNLNKQEVLLNRGKVHGVKVGQAVIDEKGLIGQIIHVYGRSSRLLMVTDKDQSVAVLVKRTGQRAMVSGNGFSDTLRLDYIFKSSDVRVGDELISSGLGGRIPAGYSVGKVTRINKQKITENKFIEIDVAPSADFVNNSYVLILQDKHKQAKDKK